MNGLKRKEMTAVEDKVENVVRNIETTERRKNDLKTQADNMLKVQIHAEEVQRYGLLMPQFEVREAKEETPVHDRNLFLKEVDDLRNRFAANRKTKARELWDSRLQYGIVCQSGENRLGRHR